MAPSLVGRARLALTRAVVVCVTGLVLGLLIATPRASAAKDAPTPNPAPNHTVSPTDPPHSPIPAPAPPDVGALTVANSHDHQIGHVQQVVQVRPVTRPRAPIKTTHVALSADRQFAESLLISGLGAFAIAAFGLIGLGVRRRLW
jgi:hypothetical protein